MPGYIQLFTLPANNACAPLQSPQTLPFLLSFVQSFLMKTGPGQMTKHNTDQLRVVRGIDRLGNFRALPKTVLTLALQGHGRVEARDKDINEKCQHDHAAPC